MADEILGQFTSGMDRRTRRGGKNGPQQLWSLINGYINAKKDIVPRPGLQHVADVSNSAGLYGQGGVLHVFHSGAEGFVDPGNPLVNGNILRYPLDIDLGPPPVTDPFGLFILSLSPILYLPMTETTGTKLYDVSGNNHHGSLVAGEIGQMALRTDGRSIRLQVLHDVATVPNFAELDTIFEDSHPWSSAICMRRTGLISASTERLFGKFVNPVTGNSTFAIEISPVDGGGHSFVTGYYNDLSGSVNAAADPTPIVNDTSFIYVTTYDGANVRLYKNGTLVDTTPSTNPGQNINTELTIGAGHGTLDTSYQFEGYLSDAMLFDGALGEDQILQMAQMGGFA